MQWRWDKNLCVGCELEGVCTRCIHTGGLETNIRWLAESTPLMDIQHIFNLCTTISPVSEYGYSLTSLDTYLRLRGDELPCDVDTFYKVLGRLLVDLNNRFIQQTNNHE